MNNKVKYALLVGGKQMKKWLKSEQGSMAVYATGLTLTFIIILMAIFALTSSVRKNQLQTELKIKEVYEQDITSSTNG